MTNTSEEITLWVDLYTEDLYKWAMSRLSDIETAKDVVQETFITAFQKLGSFEGKSSPKTWLVAILNNKIIDLYRRKANDPTVRAFDNEHFFFDDDGMWRDTERPAPWEAPPELLDDHEFANTLEKCMEKLPKPWLTAVKSKYLLDRDGNDICKELNVSSSNYWQMIHRAKLSLRQCIEVNWFKK
jgi:RNA polymerase sigma-70 factor (TIGR02943 family)